MLPKIKVAIVEDAEIARETLQKIINRSEEFECTQVYSNAEDAIRFIPLQTPDIVLMDIHLPGKNGIECVAVLRDSISASCQFMMCTVSGNEEHVFEALKQGATGYLLKDFTPGELLTALKDLYNGGSPMSAPIARMVVSAFQKNKQVKQEMPEVLSGREQEILQLLSEGLRYKEISDKLFISLDTVKKHCHNIYRKLQVENRTEALNKIVGR